MKYSHWYCPKCTAQNPHIQFMLPNAVQAPSPAREECRERGIDHEGEHFHVTCSRCGYADTLKAPLERDGIHLGAES